MINRNSKNEIRLENDRARFFSGTVWNLIGAFAFAFSAWLTTFIIAKYYGSGQYESAGIFAVAASLGNIFRIVSTYGLRAYQVSETGGDSADRIYIVTRIITVFLGALLCFATSLALGYNTTQILAINIYMVYQSVCAFADVLHGVLQRRGRIDRAGVSLVIRSAVATVVFMIILYLTGDLLVSLGALVVSAMLVLLFYDFPQTKRFYTFRVQSKDFRKPEPYRLLKTGFPMLLYTVFLTLITFAPRLILEKMAGASEVGMFAYVFTPTVVISTFASGVLMPFLSKLVEYWNSNNLKKLIVSYFEPVLLILLAGVCGVLFSIFLGRWMLTFLYDAIVGEHAKLLAIAVIASTLLSIVTSCNNIFIVARRMILLILLNATGLLLTIIGCYLLIPQYGMYGVGYAMVAGIAIQLLISGCFVALLFIQKKKEADAITNGSL